MKYSAISDSLKSADLNLTRLRHLRAGCYKYRAMINWLAVFLVSVTYWIHDIYSQNIRDLKNQLLRSQLLYAVQEPTFNLDQYLAASQGLSHLGNPVEYPHPKQPDYPIMQNQVLGMRLLVNQQWYMLKALTDSNPDLPLRSRKLAHAATLKVLNAGQQELDISLARLQHLIDLHREPSPATPTKEQQYIAAIHKQESSLFLKLFRAQLTLTATEPKILMTTKHMVVRAEAYYQFDMNLSYVLWFFAAIFTLVANLPGPNANKNNGEP